MTEIEQLVTLYIYDLSQGMAKGLSQMFLGKQIDAIYHTSIIYMNKEWFYGGDGITYCEPGTTILGQPMQKKILGSTQITKELFDDYVLMMSQDEFAGSKYRLFEHNCNNFSNALANFLVGEDIPSEITNLPGEVLATPFGMQIKNMLESMNISPMGQSNHSFGN